MGSTFEFHGLKGLNNLVHFFLPYENFFNQLQFMLNILQIDFLLIYNNF